VKVSLQWWRFDAGLRAIEKDSGFPSMIFNNAFGHTWQSAMLPIG
jgi:hypothetical protein